jgi:hypothetical protein
VEDLLAYESKPARTPFFPILLLRPITTAKLQTTYSAVSVDEKAFSARSNTQN